MNLAWITYIHTWECIEFSYRYESIPTSLGTASPLQRSAQAMLPSFALVPKGRFYVVFAYFGRGFELPGSRGMEGSLHPPELSSLSVAIQCETCGRTHLADMIELRPRISCRDKKSRFATAVPYSCSVRIWGSWTFWQIAVALATVVVVKVEFQACYKLDLLSRHSSN